MDTNVAGTSLPTVATTARTGIDAEPTVARAAGPASGIAADQVAPISRQVWDAKYRLKAPDGTPLDQTMEDTWRRVARALAAAERDPAAHEPRFFQALQGFRFLPAGRILSGAGTARRVTLFNCFVMGNIADDLGSIFAHLREAALTMQQGGGIGYDFSSLRPKGAPVRGVGADASGPLSFMDVWDAMCRTIMSAGARRGAMMATLRCDHPDIEAFVAAKQEPGRLRNFNLSVLVTDAFMAAVDADADWPLVFGGQTYRTLRARDLWDRITRATYDYAEPGVIFIDRINAKNNLYYCERISSTNPCGEQPLPPYGACLLGSINLASLVVDPFGPASRIDDGELAELTATAVRMLDNAINVSGFALEAQREEAAAKRRIGLGVTGLADALAMCGLRYGSTEAAEQAERWAHGISRAAYLASVELAREKGAFPLYDRDAYLAGETVRGLDADVRDGIARHGIRNALLTSVAPTGTISLVADNVSSGIEPVFALAYVRKVLQPDGTRREEEVTDHAVRVFRERFGADAPLPAHFVTAQDLAPAEHVRMQAAVQRHVDSAISKTVNVPESISFADFQEVYHLAYRSGCKGCTTYRPNAVTGSVLEVKPATAPEGSQPETPVVPPVPPAASGKAAPAGTAPAAVPPAQPAPCSPELATRPEKLVGATYKLRWPDSEHAIYVTVNDVEGPDGARRPFEVFVNSKNLEHYAWVVALTRMISAVFRRGGDVGFVAEELQQVFDPRGGQWSHGRYVPSLVAAIGEVIERHMRETGFLPRQPGAPDPGAATDVHPHEAGPDAPRANEASAADAAAPAPRALGSFCPRCSQPGLVREGGCLTCLHCGWSKCG